MLFELSLIPTLALILKWGYQPERLQAGYYIILYTICASLPLLAILNIIYQESGSLRLNNSYTHSSCLVSIAFFTAFLVKLPTWGTHLWLPKAHVEAPVAGSMILAGILLKLGGYGLMKFTYITKSCNNFTLFIIASSLWGSLLVSLVCINSIDIKKLIAYSSVVHMNLLILGLFSKRMIGMKGAIIMIISHGISSPGIFAIANFNYIKTKTRNILLHNSLAPTQPPIMLAWFLLLAANIAAPPSLNLAREVLITMAILKITFFSAIPLAFITFFSAAYNLYMYSSQQGKTQSLPHQKTNSCEFLTAIIQSTLCYVLILAIPLWIWANHNFDC